MRFHSTCVFQMCALTWTVTVRRSVIQIRRATRVFVTTGTGSTTENVLVGYVHILFPIFCNNKINHDNQLFSCIRSETLI